MFGRTAADRRRNLTFIAAAMTFLWIVKIHRIEQEIGLFGWLGVDFGLFATAGKLLWQGRLPTIHDPAGLTEALRPYLAFSLQAENDVTSTPVPHQALTYVFYIPFAFFWPPLGFLLFAIANLGIAAYVIRRFVARFPEPSWALSALLLTFLPLVYSVFVGQPVLILFFAFFQAYQAWERGRDFKAGLWCGLLFLKVQYPIFLLIVLIAKGRWRAVLGMAVTGVFIILSSWAAFGNRGMVGLLGAMRNVSGFRSVHPFACPRQMINWRGLLVNLLPAWVSESQGMYLTLALSVLTASVLLIIWRGPWIGDGPRFASQVLATMVVTMLANFHNHIHGATLLMVPAMALWARGGMPSSLAWLMRAAICMPTLLLCLTSSPELVAFLMIGLMVAALAIIVAGDLAREGHPAKPRSGGLADEFLPALD